MPRLRQITLLDCLEDYLKNEGLVSVIPAHRRENLFKVGLGAPWILWLVCSSVLFLYLERLDITEALIAAIVAVAILVALSAIEDMYASYYQARNGQQIDDLAQSLVLSIAAPVLLAIVISIWLRSFSAFWSVLIFYLGGLLVLLILNRQSERLYTVYSQLRLAAKMMVQSLTLASILMPLVLVFVLFSVFSQEIWRVLSSLQVYQAAGGLLLISLPALVYTRASFRQIVEQLVARQPACDLERSFRDIDSIEESRLEGFITRDELDSAAEQVRWRRLTHMEQEVHPPIQGRLRLLLYLLSICMTLVLWLAFALYFFLLFYALIPDEVASGWMEMSDDWNTPARLPLVGWDLGLMQVHLMEMKTALALGGILAISANVYALTETRVRDTLLEWLRPVVAQWQAAGFFYRSLISADIQIWRYAVDLKSRSALVLATVPPELSGARIQAAARRVRSELSDYGRVEVKIYPLTENFHGETTEWADRWWHLVDDPVPENCSFVELPPTENSHRTNHMLGRQLSERGEPIPDDWFGLTPETAALARGIWEDDQARPSPVILHPYAEIISGSLAVDIRLRKRLARFKDHMLLLNQILRVVAESAEVAQQVSLVISFGESGERICSLEWNRPMDVTNYRDGKGKLLRSIARNGRPWFSRWISRRRPSQPGQPV